MEINENAKIVISVSHETAENGEWEQRGAYMNDEGEVYFIGLPVRTRLYRMNQVFKHQLEFLYREARLLGWDPRCAEVGLPRILQELVDTLEEQPC